MIDVPEQPPPELRFRRRVRFVGALQELWVSREVIKTLAERELRARYKQAVLGIAWVVITPVALMVVFTVFFQRVAKVDTGGAPYPLFAYLGLLPWTFFSTSVSQGGQSLLQNLLLLNKVYFPREVFPIASVAVAATDAALASVALGVLLIVYRVPPGFTALWVIPLLLIQVAFALGVALIVSAMTIYVRDLRHVLPIALQLGLFATPVAFGIEAVPSSLRTLYVAVNPLAAVIDGYRRALLLGEPPIVGFVYVAAFTTSILLVGGYRLFKRVEVGFADVA